jgi:hypothetical protein
MRPSRATTEGLALTLGFGHRHGGLGASADYLVPLSPRWTLGPWLGAGAMPLETRTVASLGGGLTLRGAFRPGSSHRAVLDTGWVAAGLERLPLHGVFVDERVAYGPSLAFGYEFVAARGFVFRALVGGAYAVATRAVDPFTSVTFDVGVGYKWW